MANMIQRVMYEGYLGADPVMKFTGTGTAVTNFRIGSSRAYKNAAGEKVKETTWLKIVAWASLAEICNEYLHKGSHVFVEGRLTAGENGSPKTFQLKDGNWAASYEVTATDVRILDTKPTEGEVEEKGEDFDF